ncbi:MAG: hypothetical protein ACYC57_11155, partial [Thermoleophilia bacterium]
WKHGAGIAWNSYLSPVVNVVFDEVFTLADPDSSWSERGIAVVFLASGGVGKAAKGVKLADDLFDGAKALDRVGDAGRGTGRADEGVELGRRTGRAKNKLGPDHDAQGPHSVYKSDKDGNITNYETYKQQRNPQNQNPWELEKRFDGNHYHYNKKTKELMKPHVHDKKAEGGSRYPKEDEIP